MLCSTLLVPAPGPDRCSIRWLSRTISRQRCSLPPEAIYMNLRQLRARSVRCWMCLRPLTTLLEVRPLQTSASSRYNTLIKANCLAGQAPVAALDKSTCDKVEGAQATLGGVYYLKALRALLL